MNTNNWTSQDKIQYSDTVNMYLASGLSRADAEEKAYRSLGGLDFMPWDENTAWAALLWLFGANIGHKYPAPEGWFAWATAGIDLAYKAKDMAALKRACIKFKAVVRSYVDCPDTFRSIVDKRNERITRYEEREEEKDGKTHIFIHWATAPGRDPWRVKVRPEQTQMGFDPIR